MRVAADFFLGLVTHPKSRFPEARGPQGLLESLARELRSRGVSVDLGVIDENLLDSENQTFTSEDVRASITAELSLEKQWREYVRGGQLPLLTRAAFSLRKAVRARKFVTKGKSTSGAVDAGERMIFRLANIELAHMAIIDLALESEARWVLILEDDAKSLDVIHLAKNLCEFVAWVDNAHANLGTINLSESFSLSQLGIEHLLKPMELPAGVTDWQVFISSRHVTNTVCAVLYRREFLLALATEMKQIPLKPVVPIDFKVNAALMKSGSQLPGETWVCSPAPIVQGSGVPTTYL